MNVNQQQVRSTAERMVTMHRSSGYRPEQRAVDHAFGYDLGDWRHNYWLAVANTIRETTRKTATGEQA